MKKIILLFIFISLPVFGQINFENGYFINNNNVKTECLIRNFGWQKNPTEIEYKLNENDESKKITIANIKEFNVRDSYKYKRFKVNIDKSSSDINNLSIERNPIWKEETLFLKILVEGEINLYEYGEVNLTHYFISSGIHETAEQLVYKEYEIESNRIGENNYYKQQLSNTLKTNFLNTNDFQNLSYKKKDLTNLILKYNTSKNAKTNNYETKQSQDSINFKIIVGLNSTSLSFNNGVDNTLTTKYSFNTKTVFRIGLESEYVSPFNQNKWSIFTDPNFQSYKIEEKTKSNESFESNYSFVEIPIGFRYHMFINYNSKIFINIGLAPAIMTSKSTITYSGTYLDISNSMNYFIGTGFTKGHFGIELRYNLSRNLLLSYQNWESRYKSIGVLVGYKLF